MRRTVMINFALLFAGILTAALAGEILIRVFWRNAPQSARAKDDKIITQSPDIREGQRFVPNSKGFWWWTEVSINSQGLRDREFPSGKQPGTTRIMVAGDSFVFGLVVPQEANYPKFLEKTLTESGGGARFEVINAGVAGYNFSQELASLERLVPHYRPDIVIVSLIYNDTELHGVSDMGWTPAMSNHQKGNFPKPHPALRRLYKLMLPDEESGFSGRLRYFLANHSRMYLFAALSFRTLYMVPNDNREMAQFRLPACQNELLIWGRFGRGLEALKSMGRKYGFKTVIVFYTDLFMEGHPYARMRAAVEESGLPLLDLSYLWGDRETYVRKYSLRWDFHPNALSYRLAADATAGFLAAEGVILSNEKLKEKFEPAEYAEAIRAREKLHHRAEEEETAQFRALSRRLSTEIAFGKREPLADQLLYGWWEKDMTDKLKIKDARWGAMEASAFLRNPGNARSLTVEGIIPADVLENVGAPNVTVELDCGAARTTRRITESDFSIELALPEKYRNKPLLEVGISSDMSPTST